MWFPQTCPYLMFTVQFVYICMCNICIILTFVLRLALFLFPGTFNSKVDMPPLTAAENNLLNGDKGDEVWVYSLQWCHCHCKFLRMCFSGINSSFKHTQTMKNCPTLHISRSSSRSVKKEMSQNLLQWTVADVASYFSAAGFPDQAVAFRAQVRAPPQSCSRGHWKTSSFSTQL